MPPSDPSAVGLAGLNPYQSPQTSCQIEGVVFNDGVQHCQAELLRGGFLYRRLRVYGQVEADVEWDGRTARECIRVGSKTVVSKWPLWYIPRFDFQLRSADQSLPATVELRLSWGLPLLVRRFRLLISGRTVYSEGDW